MLYIVAILSLVLVMIDPYVILAMPFNQRSAKYISAYEAYHNPGLIYNFKIIAISEKYSQETHIEVRNVCYLVSK